VLGGTFDPIHNGHLAMARAAREALDLERVLLVPAGMPPHKQGEITPFADRLEMVRLAASGTPWLEVSDLEGRRGGISYTVDTLRELAVAHPRAALFFIIGEDTIPELRLWRDLPGILDRARIAAVSRPGPRRSYGPLLFPGIAPEKLEALERDRIEMAPVPVASREVRRAVARGESIDQLVPPAVAGYIRERGLYRPGAEARKGRP